MEIAQLIFEGLTAALSLAAGIAWTKAARAPVPEIVVPAAYTDIGPKERAPTMQKNRRIVEGAWWNGVAAKLTAGAALSLTLGTGLEALRKLWC